MFIYVIINIFRAIKDEKGSLCSLAFMYLALHATIKHKSEIRSMDYDIMKNIIINETMYVERISSYDVSKDDKEILADFRKGRIFYPIRLFIR